MKWYSYLILFFIVIFVINGCKKNSKENSLDETITDNDADLPDSLLSTKDAKFLMNLPHYHYTAKDLVLADGQGLYDYFQKNDPSTLIGIASSDQQKQVFGTQTPLTTEQMSVLLKAKLNIWAEAYTTMFPYADQPHGLAYVYGSKNLTRKRISADYKDKKGVSHKAACQESYYGLDCSGFVYQVGLKASIPFTFLKDEGPNTDYFMDASHWDKAFYDMGYSELHMKDFPRNTVTKNDVKAGDIIYWPNESGTHGDHIGIIGKGSDNRLIVFAANGHPKFDCETNSAFEKGTIQWDLDDAISWNPHFGLLRITTQSVVYSYTITLPTAYQQQYQFGIGNDTKLFFGNYNSQTLCTTVSVYDTVSKVWSSKNLSVPRTHFAIAAAGKKFFLAGGENQNGSIVNIVDICDFSSGSEVWTQTQLPKGRSYLVGASAGNKVFFSGGVDDNASGLKNIDVYDLSGKWDASMSLKTGRTKFASAGIGNTIVFAGGQDGSGPRGTSSVEIYDVSTQKWAYSTLPQADYLFHGVGTSNYIVFDGGGLTNYSFPVFNVKDYSWSALQIQQSFYGAAGAVGNYLVIGGSGAVGCYSLVTGNTTTFNIPSKNYYLMGASAGNTVMLLNSTSSTSVTPNQADIFTLVQK